MPSDKSVGGILVVDEDRPSAARLVATLARAGYAASAAYGTAEAIRAIATTRWDLVVVDIKARAPEGLVLAGTLRDQFDVPLLFITALQDEVTARQATALGAISYLIKPEDLRQCIPTIGTALARAAELRRLRQSETQLYSALEQNRATGAAVGILVERLRLDREEAFETLRKQASSCRRTVSEVAEQLLSATESLNALDAAESQRQPRLR
jgi:response regulator NasT